MKLAILGHTALLLGFAWVSAPRLMAQNPSLTFSHYREELGLSQSSVQGIAQDHAGFLWVGTQDGLNRFDGYNFRVFRHEADNSSSMPSNWVSSLFCSSRGEILVGSLIGASVLDPNTYTFKPLDLGLDSQSMDIEVSTFSEDSEGRIWVGRDGGISILDSELNFQKKVPLETPPEAPSKVYRIKQDPLVKGAMWVSTFTRQLFHVVDDKPEPVLAADKPGPIAVAEDGSLWLGTRDSLLHYFPATGIVKTFRPPKDSQQQITSITHVLLTADGQIWLCNSGQLITYDPKKDRFIFHQHNPSDITSVTKERIVQLFLDPMGVVWLGSHGDGLSSFNPATKAFRTYRFRESAPFGMPAVDVGPLAQDSQGGLWVANNGAISRLDEETGRFYPLPQTLEESPFKHRYISALAWDQQDRLWIGTIDTLDIYDPEQNKFTSVPTDSGNPNNFMGKGSLAILKSHSGGMWVAAHGEGLDYYQPETGIFTHYLHNPEDPFSISETTVSALLEADDTALWVGTLSSGLNRMSSDGTFQRFNKEEHRLNSSNITVLLQDASQQIWVGTRDGIFRLRKESAFFESLGTSNGLPNQMINALLEDENGMIWASTNQGLARIDPRDNSVFTYYKEDGLQGNEFNNKSFVKCSNGALLFGGTLGLTSFFPQDLPISMKQPKAMLTELRLFNRPVPISATGPLTTQPWLLQELELAYQDNVFSFQFTGLGVANTKRISYAFSMEGFDKTWIEADGTNRFATYTNLPYGSYRFRVKASNKSIWSPLETALQLHVNPPFWRTSSAYILYSLSLIFLVVATYWNAQRSRRILEKKVIERTAQLHFQNEALDNRNRELEGIDHIVRTINVQIQAEAVMQVLTEQIFRLFPGADRVSCFLLDTSADEYCIVASHGFGDEAHKDMSVGRARLEERYEKSTEQVAEGIRVARCFRERIGESRLEGIPLAESLVAISIVLSGITVGFVVVDNLSNPDAFKSSDFQMLVRLRQHAIATLLRARQINELIEAQRKLADAAHAAGMAESAIDVLHHLGNKLNSVKTTAQQLGELVQKDEATGLLSRFAARLAEPEMLEKILADPDRSKKLCEMLTLISEKVTNHQVSLRKESEQLDLLLQEVTQSLLSQQQVTREDPETLLESIDLSKVISDALHNEIYLLREKGIHVEKQMKQLGPVLANRARMQRIISYLLENAREAMAAGNGVLMIKVEPGLEGTGIMSISDNGLGIDMVLLETIFRDGFSTKSGRRGFGLHYCANAVKEMNGQITVVSAGEGQGTCVTISLPLAEEKAQPETGPIN